MYESRRIGVETDSGVLECTPVRRKAARVVGYGLRAEGVAILGQKIAATALTAPKWDFDFLGRSVYDFGAPNTQLDHPHSLNGHSKHTVCVQRMQSAGLTPLSSHDRRCPQRGLSRGRKVHAERAEHGWAV